MLHILTTYVTNYFTLSLDLASFADFLFNTGVIAAISLIVIMINYITV